MIFTIALQHIYNLLNQPYGVDDIRSYYFGAGNTTRLTSVT